MGLVSHCHAAMFFFYRDAQESGIAHLLPHLAWEFILPVGLLCKGFGDFAS
jgi:hypothetical protein